MKSSIFKVIGNILTLLIKGSIFRKLYNSIYENSSQRWVNIFHQYVHFKFNRNFIWKIKLLNGKSVITEVDMENYKTLQFALDYKWYSPGIARVENIVLTEIGSKGIYIDIGANLGMRSLCALSNGQETVMFEPNTEVSTLNESRCELNGFRNYTLIRKGVSSSTGKVSFSIDNTSYKSSIEPTKETEIINKVTIETVSLDDWMNEYSIINKRAFVKVDIEGHEDEMIKGAKYFIETIKPTLIIEINDKDKNFIEIFNFFRLKEYHCFALYSDRWDDKLLRRIESPFSPTVNEVTDFFFTIDQSIIKELSRVTF